MTYQLITTPHSNPFLYIFPLVQTQTSLHSQKRHVIINKRKCSIKTYGHSMCMIFVHTKCHSPCSNCLLVFTIRLMAKHIIPMAVVFSKVPKRRYCILQFHGFNALIVWSQSNVLKNYFTFSQILCSLTLHLP